MDKGLLMLLDVTRACLDVHRGPGGNFHAKVVGGLCPVCHQAMFTAAAGETLSEAVQNLRDELGVHIEEVLNAFRLGHWDGRDSRGPLKSGGD